MWGWHDSDTKSGSLIATTAVAHMRGPSRRVSGAEKKSPLPVTNCPLVRYPRAGRTGNGATAMNDSSIAVEETSVIARFEVRRRAYLAPDGTPRSVIDRKSTRLNSSHI